MKIIRSAKCSLKFSTENKLSVLKNVLSEYGKVVNIFIDNFWEMEKLPGKTDLLKDVVDIPLEQTWLSARLRKVAAREAIDMILSAKNVADSQKKVLQQNITFSEKKVESSQYKSQIKKHTNKLKILTKKLNNFSPSKPAHKGQRMNVSCTIANLYSSEEANNFDSWLHLQSIGNKIIFDLPIKFHKQYLKWNELGKRLNSYIITDKYVQFCFEIETGKKKEGINNLGIDTGINALASCSNENQYGTDIKENIARIKRCKQGSAGQKKARRALRQRIDEIAKQLIYTENPDLIVVEQLKNLGKKTKDKRLLSKNIRRSIGIWNWRYWLSRLEQQCEENRVSFRSVSPYQTSITCSNCNHVDRMNRQSQECFVCQSCGHTGNADINASKNILRRFITGKYGSGCKQENKDLNLPLGKFV